MVRLIMLLSTRERKVDHDLNQKISPVGATSTLSANMEEKNKEGFQISNTKATQIDHKSRIPTKGQAGDSSPSMALMENHGSQHATRSIIKKRSHKQKGKTIINSYSQNCLGYKWINNFPSSRTYVKAKCH